MGLRVAFLGTPEMAVPSLDRLIQSGFHVPAVLTQPDRPKGRGQRLVATPVKEAALRLGLPVHQPGKLNRPEVTEFLREIEVDAMAIVAYGKIIPQAIIDIPALGIINVHFSLLPKYRGAAPVQWAIANGETVTGVTTMLVDAGLDTGDILLIQETSVGAEETAVELSERLAPLGADLLVETLSGLAAGRIARRKQDHERASLAPILTKENGLIDWKWPASMIHNRTRGFQPWPGAYTFFRGQSLHIWKSGLAPRPIEEPAGTLWYRDRRLLVACGEATALELLEVQLEGRKRISAEAFANGQRLKESEQLGSRGEQQK